MQLARFLLICVDNAADGSPSWAVYDDDKPVKKIKWEEVAKQQASVMIWTGGTLGSNPWIPPLLVSLLLDLPSCLRLLHSLARFRCLNPQKSLMQR